MSSVAGVEREIESMLRETLPEWLRDEIGVEDAREWVREHIARYAEEKARFPDEPLLPWTNMIARDDWVRPTFFIVLLLREDTVELFCGTGPWPRVREFAEGEADDIPADELHCEWALRFAVPCEPVILSRADVKRWLGCEW